jgi:hypothetical protein
MVKRNKPGIDCARDGVGGGEDRNPITDIADASLHGQSTILQLIGGCTIMAA